MKRMLVPILVVGVILLSACGVPAEFVVTNLQVTPATGLEEGNYRITVDVENVGGVKGAYQLMPKVDDEEMESIEVELSAGEKKTVTLNGAEFAILGLATEYREGKIEQKEHVVSIDGLSETITFVAPAKFLVTNLQIMPVPGSVEGTYRITVDVENTGGLKGAYQLMPKVDDEEMEPVEVELNAGEKKTVTLSGAELAILGLATEYKEGKIDQKEHIISIDGLSKTVAFEEPTPPEPVVKLQLLSAYGLRQDGGLTVNGEVKNISDESLKDVEAVVEFYTSAGELLQTNSALIKYNPILPGQTSYFEVTTTGSQTVARFGLFLRFASGDKIPTEDKRQ